MKYSYTGRRVRVAALLLAGLAASTPGVYGQTITGAAQQQISAILQTKDSFTAAQKKMSADLAFAALSARGALNTDVPVAALNLPTPDVNGNVTVDIKTVNTLAARLQVQAVGGQVVNWFDQFGAVRARIPVLGLEQVAGIKEVRWMRSADRYAVNRARPGAAPLLAAAKRERRNLLRAQLARLVEQARPAQSGSVPQFPSLATLFRPNGLAFFIGSLTSQGYISHGANVAVNSMAVNGSGIKVGVLSDSASVAQINALIASGDLPVGTSALPGQNGSGTDEGTAMMEIIADVAPGATILFATADPSEAQFAANIIALRAAGCQIIVDDVTYFAEGAFQDGAVAQAVNTVVAGGALYFSSAANSGNVTRGTSGTWEGDFVNGGAAIAPVEAGTLHNFGGQNFDVLIAGTQYITLKWSDPLGASTNDYDLFILNSAGTAVTASSVDTQSGIQDPFEIAFLNSGTFAVNSRIVVVNKGGLAAARALRIDTNRGRLSIATTGSTYGHNAGASTLSIAATYWNSAKTGTRAFVGTTNVTEVFSSDGPRKVFYNPNGTVITPGNVLFGTNGGTTLAKPDLSAADGTSARTPGFNPFFGTSAAAPHAAAVAALVWSSKLSATNNEVRTAMISTALDNMAAGADRDGGFGIPMAPPAISYLLTH